MTAISDLLSANQVSALRSTNDFRLTLSSGTPVTTSDLISQTTLYMTPYLGTQIGLYVDGAWVVKETAEVSVSTSGLTGSKSHDVFAYWTGSAVALEFVTWTNDSTRATAIVRQDGVWVKSGDPTRRYIGTVRTTSNPNELTDADYFRGVWNAQNQVIRRLFRSDGTAHSYTTGAWRNWNNSSTSTLIEWVLGLPQTMVVGSAGLVQGSPGGGYLSPSINGSTVGSLRISNTAGTSYSEAAGSGAGQGVMLSEGYYTGIMWEYGAAGWYLYRGTIYALLMG